MARKRTISQQNAAKKNKNDEFYTQLEDIEKELYYYKEHFKNKVVFCNCDDPYESNFFKYFALNFNALGLKKLICTCYDGSPIADQQLTLFEPAAPYGKQEKTRVPHKIVITEVPDVNGDGTTDLTDVEWLLKNDKNVLTTLDGNGDFRSPECVALLNESDIVVTNPPFSLFREFLKLLYDYNKKFLIIGNIDAVTYVGCFEHIRDNQLWWGVTTNGSNRWMRVPDNYEESKSMKIVNGVKYCFVNKIMWYTNMNHEKRKEEHILYKEYSPEEYPKYDNYDAIMIDDVSKIPMDYDGVMGVPISFLNKFCPTQFEILGCNRGVNQDPNGVYGRSSYLNGKETYKTLFIRKKQ